MIAIDRHSAGELGVTMVAAGRVPDDERVFLQSFRFGDRESAYAWAAQVRRWYPSSRVLASEDLVGDKGARDLHARKVGRQRRPARCDAAARGAGGRPDRPLVQPGASARSR